MPVLTLAALAEKFPDVAVRSRIAAEQSVLRRIVRDAIKAGFSLSVFDGAETTLRQSVREADVLAALMTTDQDSLSLFKAGKLAGAIQLVYGNDGWDVIANYHTSLEEFLAPINAWAEEKGE